MDDSFVIPFPPFEPFSSTDFEKAVVAMLSAQSKSVENLRVEHLANETDVDGKYEIDVLMTFQFAGMNFKVLVECKNHGRPIQRDMVQVLHSRMQSLGAQKGAIFPTHGFQTGAIRFAEIHGIALVRICHGEVLYETRSLEPIKTNIGPAASPEFVGRCFRTNGDNGVRSQDVDLEKSWLTQIIKDN